MQARQVEFARCWSFDSLKSSGGSLVFVCIDFCFRKSYETAVVVIAVGFGRVEEGKSSARHGNVYKDDLAKQSTSVHPELVQSN